MVEIVIAMVLFFAVGGSFVYASSVIESSRKQSLNETKSTISQSTISNSFRADINSAKALKLNSASNLLVARSDGKCVSWIVSKTANETSSKLYRSVGQGVAASAKGSEMTSKISNPAIFNLGSDTASFNIAYSNGSTFKESAPLRLSGSNGGVCW